MYFISIGAGVEIIMKKSELISKAKNYLSGLVSDEEQQQNIKTKFGNVCGKTTKGSVPIELWQKRTHRKNRVLISWKTVKNNNLTLSQLETFSGGVVVEFINEDYFQEDDNSDSLFNVLKNRLGSDEVVSSMISIRNEDGGSSSNVARLAFSKLKNEIPDYEDHLIKRKSSVTYSGLGNDKWEGFIYYSIKGGQQDTIISHSEKPFPQLFNPAYEFANIDVCLDIDLVLIYFAMFSVNTKNLEIEKKTMFDSLIQDIEKSLKESFYDSGNLLDYCKNHPSMLMEPGNLFDPIQVEQINLVDFSIKDKKDDRNLDLAHNEAVNKDKYYFDNSKQCILTPARPGNLSWSKQLSNMMQQNFSLTEYFEHEEKIVAKRREKLKRN